MALSVTMSLRMVAVMATLEGFAVLPERGGEAAQDGIVPERHQRGHVEGGADAGATGSDVARRTRFAAVPVDGREAGEVGGFALAERAELGHGGEQRRGRHRADAGEGCT